MGYLRRIREQLANNPLSKQVLPEPRLPYHEEAQPPHSHPDARGLRHRAASLCQIRYANTQFALREILNPRQ